jgi:hypothetical protein
MTFRKIKDPDAVLDYSIDWSAWLGSDTITTSEWFVDGADTDLAVDSDSKSTTATTVWLSGGTLGVTYTATNRITTADGRTDDRSISVQILDR